MDNSKMTPDPTGSDFERCSCSESAHYREALQQIEKEGPTDDAALTSLINCMEIAGRALRLAPAAPARKELPMDSPRVGPMGQPLDCHGRCLACGECPREPSETLPSCLCPGTTLGGSYGAPVAPHGEDLSVCGGCGGPSVVWREDRRIGPSDPCAWVREPGMWVFDCKEEERDEVPTETPVAPTKTCEPWCGSERTPPGGAKFWMNGAHDGLRFCTLACGTNGRPLNQAAPPVDEAKPDEPKGLYRKFTVERSDGSSGHGKKHEHCEYFVLDWMHDKFAVPAMRAYAAACEADFPELAKDIRDQIGAAVVRATPSLVDNARAGSEPTLAPQCRCPFPRTECPGCGLACPACEVARRLQSETPKRPTPALPDGYTLGPGWRVVSMTLRGVWICTGSRSPDDVCESALYRRDGEGACGAHAVEMGALVPTEVRVEPAMRCLPWCGKRRGTLDPTVVAWALWDTHPGFRADDRAYCSRVCLDSARSSVATSHRCTIACETPRGCIEAGAEPAKGLADRMRDQAEAIKGALDRLWVLAYDASGLEADRDAWKERADSWKTEDAADRETLRAQLADAEARSVQHAELVRQNAEALDHANATADARVAEAIAGEREACAKVAEITDLRPYTDLLGDVVNPLAEAIRARRCYEGGA